MNNKNSTVIILNKPTNSTSSVIDKRNKYQKLADLNAAIEKAIIEARDFANKHKLSFSLDNIDSINQHIIDNSVTDSWHSSSC